MVLYETEESLETISELNFSRFFGSFEPIFDSNLWGAISTRYITAQI